MKNVYEKILVLNANDGDFQSKLSIPAIMRFFQVAAGEHSIIMKMDHFTIVEKNNAFWVITKVKLKIFNLPMWGEKVLLRTWPLLPTSIKCNRDFEFINDKNEVLIQGISEWCILDLDNRRPRRVSSTCYPLNLVHLEKRSFDDNFVHFKTNVLEDELLYERVIRSSDIDLNLHTNNTIYSNMVMDAFSVTNLATHELKDYEIHFSHESKEGETLRIYRSDLENKVLISGIEKDSGKIVFQTGIKFVDK